jgi:hypothetical protein
MLADAGAPAVLAPAPLAVMLADAGAPAVLAGVPLVVMLADAGAPAVRALAPLAVMPADAGAAAVLALSPLAVMLADAGAPAVLALAPVANSPVHRAGASYSHSKATAVAHQEQYKSLLTDGPPSGRSSQRVEGTTDSVCRRDVRIH